MKEIKTKPPKRAVWRPAAAPKPISTRPPKGGAKGAAAGGAKGAAKGGGGARPDGERRPKPATSERRMSRISHILSEMGLHLRKALGQNFLVNQGALEKIAASVGATKDSAVIEIGCGLGNLTELIAREAGTVFAVELDERFAALHKRELGHLPNLAFLYADFMEIDLKSLVLPVAQRDVRVIGNIPYHLTSPILFKLMASSVEFSAICLLMQREVGVRLAALPGSRDYGILSAKAHVRFDVSLVFTISPGSFLPPPKVHSSLVRLSPRAGGPLVTDGAERADFFNFIDAAFAQRRKMVCKSLEAASKGLLKRDQVVEALKASGLDADVRAEAMPVERLLALFRALGRPHLAAVRKVYED